MKLHTQLIAASALTLCMATTFAAESTTLKVTGQITVESCAVTMPEGNIDFGNITDADLDNSADFSGRTLQRSQQLSVVVNCKGDTAIAIHATDNNAGTKPETGFRYFRFGSLASGSALWTSRLLPESQFGIGRASNGASLGAYAIAVGKITVDDKQVISIGGPDLASWQVLNDRNSFFGNNTITYITGASSGTTPVAGKIFKFPLDVAMNITTADQLPAGETIKVDGGATIEVKYL